MSTFYLCSLGNHVAVSMFSVYKNIVAQQGSNEQTMLRCLLSEFIWPLGKLEEAQLGPLLWQKSFLNSSNVVIRPSLGPIVSPNMARFTYGPSSN